ncbi:hypothetical protein V1282_005487 [Nitrobacteraceae bacterium AZCC 2146]
MIVRQSVRCTICSHDHTLRIAIGSGKTQAHSFACVNCEQKLSIYFEKNYGDASFHGHQFENCEPSGREGTIVNLHPDFVIPADKVHKDKHFQSIETIQRLHRTGALERMLNSWKNDEASEVNYKEEITRNKTAYDSADFLELGAKILALYASGKVEIAQDLLTKEAAAYGLPEGIIIDDILDRLFAVGGDRAMRCRVALQDLWGRAKEADLEGAKSAWSYLEAEQNSELLSSFSGLVSSFSKSHRNFLPIMHSLRSFGSVPNDGSVSSINFDDTKMFYGNIYEVVTSAFIMPAVINNVANGRSFDRFERLILKDYLNLDKSGRHNCFANGSDLSILSENLDNQLRNASHHQAISIVSRTGRISFRAGKSSIRRSMGYAEYLEKTFLLFEVLLGLMHFIVGNRRDSSAHEGLKA